MHRQTRHFLASATLMVLLAFQSVTAQAGPSHASQGRRIEGRWRVKFSLFGGSEQNLIFESQTKGSGSFRLLDTGPNDNAVPSLLPAVWSQLTNDRVSFSGEAELPIGTCCREMGTLIFKGKFDSNNSISGKLVFVTSVDEEESPYKFRSMIGSFTATRLPNN